MAVKSKLAAVTLPIYTLMAVYLSPSLLGTAEAELTDTYQFREKPNCLYSSAEPEIQKSEDFCQQRIDNCVSSKFCQLSFKDGKNFFEYTMNYTKQDGTNTAKLENYYSRTQASSEEVHAA
jgi:hypothetical protein